MLERGKIRYLLDLTLNDQDKSWTVGSKKLWQVHYIHVHFTATATVGNRIIEVYIRDDSDNEVLVLRGNTVAANGISHKNFVPGPSPADFGGKDYVPIPHKLYLLAGWDIRIFETAGIDANDDMKIYAVVEEWDLV